MNTTGTIYNIGIPAGVPLAPAPNMLVAKQGRTTGLTCGRIKAVGVTTAKPVGYTTCTNQGFSVSFSNQILITSASAPFAIAGDSGSLIVSQSTAQPVGLLFAGQSSSIPYMTYATPSATVASRLGVTFVGGASHSVAACHGQALATIRPLAPGEIQRVKEIKEMHEAELLSNPSIIAVGVGAAEDNPSEGVIVIIVNRALPTVVPPAIDGIRTEVISSDPIVAQINCRTR